MFKSDYQKELDNIKASDEFKNRTITLLKEKQQENSKTKTVKFPKKKYIRVAACFAIFVFTTGIYMSKNKIDSQNLQQSKNTTQFSQRVNVVSSSHSTFTINDCEGLPVSYKTKIGISEETSMYQSPIDFSHNAVYSVNDDFSDLSVYKITTNKNVQNSFMTDDDENIYDILKKSIGDNISVYKSCVYNDDVRKDVSCVYAPSENYSDNILNSSLNNIKIYSLGENEYSIELNTKNYTLSENYNAINYKQALSILYSEKIPENSTVLQIDLVYKETENFAIPFYKLYVESKTQNNDSLKEFKIYYVCAIY